MHIYTLYKCAQIKIRSHLPRESKPGNVPALSFQQGILIGLRLPGSDLNKCLILKGYFFFCAVENNKTRWNVAWEAKDGIEWELRHCQYELSVHSYLLASI